MKALQVQTLLRLHGLDHVVDYLKLDVKTKDNLVLLKYKQIEANWSISATLECRGIILDSSKDWKVVAYPYDKFFNIGEGYCAPIDWSTAKYFDKLDGSLINFYYYNNKWNLQTSGTIDGTFNNNNGTDSFFQDLVWKSITSMYESKEWFLDQLDTNFNYMFELETPENIVVTPHSEYKLTLHGIRDMRSFEMIDITTMCNTLVKAKLHTLDGVDDMLAQFEHMSWEEEGFVVVDANMNYGKCKNPKYVAVHHLCLSSSPYEIINIIKTNEIDEFLAYFKSREDELMRYKSEWESQIIELNRFYNSVKHIENQKEFALEVLKYEKPFNALMFNMRNNQISNFHDGMCKLDNRFWYKRFNKEKYE